jgi:hypothetical protein
VGTAARWALYVAFAAAWGAVAYWAAGAILARLDEAGAGPAGPGLADVEDVIASAIRITREAAP